MRPVSATPKEGVATAAAFKVEPNAHFSQKQKQKPETMTVTTRVNGGARGDLATELLRMQAYGILDPLEQNSRLEQPLQDGSNGITPTVLSSDAFNILDPVDLTQDSSRKLLNKRARAGADASHPRSRGRNHMPHIIPKPPSSLYSWSIKEFTKSRTLAALAPQLRFPPEQVLLGSQNDLSLKFAQASFFTTEERPHERTLYYLRKTPRAYNTSRMKKDKLFKIAGRTSWMSEALRDLLSSEACVVARGGMDPFREQGSGVREEEAATGHQPAASCVDIILDHLDGASSHGIAKAERFSVVRVDGTEKRADADVNVASSFDGAVPNVLVGFDSNWLSVAADLLSSWEHAHFEPYTQTSVKPLSYITIRLCRSSEYDSCCHEKRAGAVSSYIADIAAMYEDCCQQTMVDIGAGGIDLCAKGSSEAVVEEILAVAGTAEGDGDPSTFSGVQHHGQAYTEMWLSLLKQLENPKLCVSLRERAMKAKCKNVLLWLVLPIESIEWVPFLMNAVAKCINCLKEAGIEAQFQLVPGESVLPWRRNKSDMHSIVTSLFMKCNNYGKHSELVILDSESSSNGSKGKVAAHEEEGEISDSDNEAVSEEDASSVNVEPCDRQWFTVGWTDESGSFLRCESFSTENMATVAQGVLKKCVDYAKPETGHVVVIILGHNHPTALPLWKSAMEKPVVRDKKLHFLLCSGVVGKVNMPWDGGKTLYKVQAKHSETLVNTESILWVSSFPSRRELDLSPASYDSAPGALSVLHIAKVHHHQRTARKQILPSMQLDTAVEHFKRLAWLSSGSFKERPLTCVPLHMSCAARLAHWLNGSRKPS